MADFQKDGYMFVPELIDASGYFKFFNKLVELGKGKIGDKQVAGARCFYREPLFEILQMHLLPKIELHTGCKLYKTLSYARQYEVGNVLAPHKDIAELEVTVSLALGLQGEIWPIWLEDRNKKHHSFLLKPGDALIFRGHELTHWREENNFGPCSQAFFGYVEQNGPNANCKCAVSVSAINKK